MIDPVVFWERISKLYKSWNVRTRRAVPAYLCGYPAPGLSAEGVLWRGRARVGPTSCGRARTRW